MNRRTSLVATRRRGSSRAARSPRPRRPGRRARSPTSCRSRPAARPTSIGRTVAQAARDRARASRSWSRTSRARPARSARAPSRRRNPTATRCSAARSARTRSTRACTRTCPYDPIKDFEPITLVGFIPNALFVSPQLGVNSVPELIALLKKDPSKRTFASSGAGTSTHLAGELFADLIGVKLTHVPYKGSPQALQDVVGGQVPFMFDQLTAGAAARRRRAS